MGPPNLIAAAETAPAPPAGAARPRHRLSRDNIIAGVSAAGIAVHLLLRYGLHSARAGWLLPLWIVLAAGGIPILAGLALRLWRRQFGSDLLAGIAIVTSALAGEQLVGAIIILMLAGGTSVEEFATGRASQVLDALARRLPQHAHRQQPGGGLADIALAEVRIGDRLLVLPHEICPVDGVVVEGHGGMDESYLTGEPFTIAKTPGSTVISGAINGDTALGIRAQKLAVDSRYAKIMQVLEASQHKQPHLRRLGDILGAWYTPLAVGLAALAWALTGDSVRFLAVIVIATPCPLILAIPVAVVGAISLAAKRSIIVKNPAALEQVASCRVVILDKTGTLTYGRPVVTETRLAPGWSGEEVLRLAASLEQFSKHPLAAAVLAAASAAGVELSPVSEISEPPGEGLRGQVGGRGVRITARGKVSAEIRRQLPPPVPGLECLVLVDEAFAAALQFRDEPRADTRPFISHLAPRHGVERVLLVSGDRESEVRYLAEQTGIDEVFAQQSPEQKLAIVEEIVAQTPTLFVGDGINDAPALTAATVGVAFGAGNDIAAEAADAVILTPVLERVDELMHISRRMRRVALQSAGFGMAASLVGMAAAAFGLLPPLAGAVAQEIIDLVAVLNAIRAAFPGRSLADF